MTASPEEGTENPRARYEIPLWLTIEWDVMREGLRARRKALGLTQVQVAELMGRSQDFVAVLENNTRTIPNLTTVMLWVNALGGTVAARWP